MKFTVTEEFVPGTADDGATMVWAKDVDELVLVHAVTSAIRNARDAEAEHKVPNFAYPSPRMARLVIEVTV
jgi:hypothetical protein